MNDACRPFRALLERHLDGELAPNETEQLGAHLASCAECRHELEELQQLDLLVRQAEPPPLAEEYWDWHRQEVWRRIRSRDRARRSPETRRSFRWLRLASITAGVAAMLLVIAGGWRLLTDAPQRERPGLLGEELAGTRSAEPEEAVRLAEPLTETARVPDAVAVVPALPPEPGTAEEAALRGTPKAELPAVASEPVAGAAGRVEADRTAPGTEAPPVAASSDQQTPEEAVARYQAYSDSVRAKAAGLRAGATGAADEPPRLSALALLPPAPGPDSLTVTVRVLVGPDGSVTRVELVRGADDPGTDSLIQRAFSRSRFQPGYRNGLPVSGWLEVSRPLLPAPATDRDH